MNKIDLLFSILTISEVEFLKYIGERLIEKGYKIGFILFHSAGEDLLKNNNFIYFNIHKLKKEYKIMNKDIKIIEDEFNISNLRDIFIREKISYNRKDERKLSAKTIAYLYLLDKILKEVKPSFVIQELGDFIANKCVYYATRKNNIDHIFYEPAPFKKRIIFTLNSYFVDIPKEIIDCQVDSHIEQEVQDYCQEYLNKGDAVIPFKDKYSFGDATVGKFLNFEYLKRLKRKVTHKYIQRKEEEYNEIAWVIEYSLLKWLRRKFLSFYYSKPKLEKYIYFPLHVPFDVQITSRSKLFYNQIYFLEYLSRIIPYGYKLYIKEHPASVGGYSFWNLVNLLKEHNNVRLVHPNFSSYHLIKNAELVVSVNSKVGFESLIEGKKVVVVGDAIYKNKGITFDVDNLKDLENKIMIALREPAPSKENIFKFLYAVYKYSYPSELFLMEKNNLEISFRSFYDFINKNITK